MAPQKPSTPAALFGGAALLALIAQVPGVAWKEASVFGFSFKANLWTVSVLGRSRSWFECSDSCDTDQVLVMLGGPLFAAGMILLAVACAAALRGPTSAPRRPDLWGLGCLVFGALAFLVGLRDADVDLAAGFYLGLGSIALALAGVVLAGSRQSVDQAPAPPAGPR